MLFTGLDQPLTLLQGPPPCPAPPAQPADTPSIPTAPKTSFCRSLRTPVRSSGDRQVKNAKLALAENHGGTAATAVVHILEAE